MANWLLDYIEMTEYVPSELREQLTSIRELDLQVHNAMDELERDIHQFFSQIDSLSPQQRQDQYDTFLKKCDLASRAASDKVKVADKLHELVEKSMRLLDQGLEKLKEDLLEGDKAYIVEDLERRSQELDEQLRLEHDSMLKRQSKLPELKSHQKNHKHGKECSSNHVNSLQNNHRRSHPAQNSNHQATNHRSRNNSTGAPNTVGRQRKRERKRLNSTMTIFNRNSRTEDDSSSQSFQSSPLTPNYITGMQDSNISFTDVVGNNDCSLTMRGMLAGKKSSAGANDKSNGHDPLAGARQPILTAMDAAHAVSPNATNSDKLGLFSNNANGDNYNTTLNGEKQTHPNSLGFNQPLPQQQQQQNQLSNHLLATVGFSSGDSTLSHNSTITKGERRNLDQNHILGAQFSALPLSSRHDPIMIAASQAISATQNMTPGRRTSSLKASYAAVNSGRLQTGPNQQILEPGVVHEVYCKCRSHIQGSDMIACDNNKCKIEWFHYECVGITTPPEGEWYCDECKVSLGIQHRGNKQPKLEGVNVT